MEEGIRELREAQAEADARVTALERAFIGIFGIVNETQKELKELAEQVNRLAEAQANTDERLNIFVTTVERYISERNNGDGQDKNNS